jgi:ion channel-forming bestrophin family protein
MYTAREIKSGIILSFAWRPLLFFFGYSLILCAAHVFFELPIGISFVPIGLIGTAVAFYVGFKNNSSYERLWEARRIWGSIVNASRTWGAFTLAYIKEDPTGDGPLRKQSQTELIHRHIAYVNALRIQLRQKTVWGDSNTIAHAVVKGSDDYADSPLVKNMSTFLPQSEVTEFTSRKNAATQIMKAQALQLDKLFTSNALTERAYIHMMGLVQEFYAQQGAAERIKNFPFPRQYAHFSKMFVNLFVLILPFGLINEFLKLGETMVWLSVPSYMIIAWVFYTMEVVGDTSENPFENAINDVPMTAICRTIEIDLREMLNEENVPAPVLPVDNILM